MLVLPHSWQTGESLPTGRGVLLLIFIKCDAEVICRLCQKGSTGPISGMSCDRTELVEFTMDFFPCQCSASNLVNSN